MGEELYEYIGNKIRELRTHYPEGSLSQDALAAGIKVAANTVSRWETGTYKPTPDDLDKLARYFNVSILTFFSNLAPDDARIAALTSATGGLNDKEFEEVIRYAEYRKARLAIEGAKTKNKKK